MGLRLNIMITLNMNWAGFLFWDFRGPLVLTSHAHATAVSTPRFVFSSS